MGLYEFTQRHAGKLVLVGTIGIAGSFYEFANRSLKYDLFANEIRQSVPEYARLKKVNNDISDLEKELNRSITLKDAIALVNPEDSRRNRYLEMQKKYDSLQKEKEALMSSPQVKNSYQVIKDKTDEINILGTLGMYFAFVIPFSFGITGLVSRPRKEKKQKSFLT